MTSDERHAAAEAARRPGKSHDTGGERRVERAIEARRDLTDGRGGRSWINGREVGGVDPRYAHLSTSYD
jgi:hypothetical protein